jgi:preprotein translocase SecE subunit
MARHRQRARDRKGRQDEPQSEPAPHDQIHRENIPSELDNLGEEDVFEASIVSGANGEPTDLDEESLAEEAEAAAQEATGDQPAPRRQPSGPRPEGNRVVNFLRASWSELKRVQWPDRRQVAQATGVVLGFVAIAGAYLGLADAVAQKIVNLII